MISSAIWEFLLNKNLMNEIKVLNEEVCAKVAAGEVVERPVNVVKELTENSLDAGADRIDIEIEDGGLALIKITDNGAGIMPDDLPRAVSRFATSKVETIDDVYSVESFGFRGEALYAVSSVSKTVIKSFREGYIGSEMSVNYGKIEEVRPSPINKGTSITVSGLFSNVPARMKFIKSSRSCQNEISKFVKQFSLLHPSAIFTLRANGKEIYKSPASLIDRAKIVFNENDLKSGVKSFGNLSCSAVVSKPNVQKLRRDGIIIGVNGRLIKDPSLTQAVVQAFFRIIPENRYPLAVINVIMDAGRIDANVHPAKTTIRITEPREIFSFVYDIVTEILNEKEEVKHEEIKLPEKEKFIPVDADARPSYSISHAMETETVVYDRGESKPFVSDKEADKTYELKTENRENIRVKGQLFDSVIVCESDQGQAYFIDQHVAHERVLYERFKKDRKEQMPGVVLYEPLVIEVEPEDVIMVEESGGSLLDFGLEIDTFGDNALKINMIPADIINRNVEKEIREIIAGMRDERISNPKDYAILTMSCKSAVKAGERLTMPEMQSIVNDLFKCDNPNTCPHGRPIFFEMEKEFMFRKFGR